MPCLSWTLPQSRLVPLLVLKLPIYWSKNLCRVLPVQLSIRGIQVVQREFWTIG